MQRTNVLLFVAVLIGLLIMTFWRLTAEEIQPLGPADSPGTDPAASSTAASGGQEGGAETGRQNDGGTGAPIELAADAPRVVVRVTPLERFVLPPPLPVRAVLMPRREPLPATLLAGTGAEPWADRAADRPLRAGAALVRVAIDGGHVVRQAVVDPTAGPTELPIGAELRVAGRVLDATGAPVADARVWFGALDGDGRTRHGRTDQDGRFDLGVRAGPGVPLVAWASGHAAAWRSVSIGVDLVREFEITLPAGGELTVQLAGQATAIGRGQVFVAPAATVSAELASYPFFLQGLVGGIELDARGRGQGTFLPASGDLALTFVHPLVAIDRHHEVTLAERAQCVVPVDFRPAWQTMATDGEGRPLADVQVLLRPAGRRPTVSSRLRMLPPQASATGCFFAVSDADGSLWLARPAPGDVLSLRAPGRAGRDVEVGEPLPDRLWLPAWDGSEPALALAPPIAGQAWRSEFALGDGVTIDRPADARATVALPHAGRFRVEMVSFLGPAERARETLDDLVVTGRTELTAPAIE